MQPMNCTTAAGRLLAHSQNQTGRDAGLDEAIAHASQCPHCKGRLGYLVRALRSNVEDALTCQQCQDQLPDYVQAQETGRTDESQWQPVALHLQTCPHCAATRTELVELTQFAYGEQGEEPPFIPTPDLSFLPHRQIAEILALGGRDRAGHRVHTGAAERAQRAGLSAGLRDSANRRRGDPNA